LYNYHRSWSYKLTNRLAKKIIVVSQRSLHYMVNVEKVPERKLLHINLAYDFSLYKIPDAKVVKQVRDKYNNGTLLVTACRLTKFKRPELSIQVLKKLRDIGIEAHLVILGTGEMLEELRRQIEMNGLSDSVSLVGHVNNPLDYIAAADFILHPSVLESSCVVIKEAGLVHKPVIVCRNIGDFDDYIVSGYNGFLVDKSCYAEEALNIINTQAKDQSKRLEMGRRLESEVYRLFDIKNVSLNYRPIVYDN
jgi:L-malate glycosyltransferase